MNCMTVVVSLVFPRVSMFFMAIFTGWFGRAYDTYFFPAVGWFFFPYTTLAYMAGMLNNDRHLSGGWLFLFGAALLVDVLGVAAPAASRR